MISFRSNFIADVSKNHVLALRLLFIQNFMPQILSQPLFIDVGTSIDSKLLPSGLRTLADTFDDQKKER